VLAIGRAGAGTNNIPVKAMSERGVVVFNAPGANANAVKELVIAGMLMGARNMASGDLNFVNGLHGDDESLHKQVEAGKKHFVGHELPGSTLGIIGLGAIGSMLADRRHPPGHERHRLRPGDHRRRRLAPAVPGQESRQRWMIWSSMPISSACTCRCCPRPRT
jgi:lactate dehydrogenase-like 2-hydroxyacid dehydrogenase